MMKLNHSDIISETVRFTLKKPERYMVALMSGMSSEAIFKNNMEIVLTLGRVWRAQQVYYYTGHNARGQILC